MDINDFATIFGDGGARVLLDWPRLLKECTVEESFARSRQELGDLFTVWYADAVGQDAGYDDAGVRPLRVSEAGVTEASWPDERAARVAAFEEGFRSADAYIQLMLAGYRAGGDIVLIDGTHRAVAAHRSDGEVRLALYVLDGPTDPAMLPDLAHHPR